MSKQTGQCLCGSVKFSVETANAEHHVCHCAMCRRWAGSPLFAAEVTGVSFSGEENIERYDSSDWAQRGFCKSCGSNLFYFFKPAQQYMLSVGVFDDQTPFKLVGEIYVDHQPAGYCFTDGLERLTEAQAIAKFTGQ